MRSSIARLVVSAFLIVVFLRVAEAGDVSASSRDFAGVVELFTSQGCASCPPADDVLTRLAADPKLIALSYHVDYWDYIGWRDPHGSRDNTERQRAYAASFGTGSIYTPQVVVNGRRDVMGAHEDEIRAAVRQTALDRPAPGAVVTLALRGERLHIAADSQGPAPSGRAPVLMLVVFDRQTWTDVDRGENEGRRLVSSNAVTSWRVLGMWEGKPLDIDMPVPMLRSEGRAGGCAAILQSVTPDGEPGPILAAAALPL